MSRRKNKINEIELQKSSQEQSFEMCIHNFIRDCKIRNLSEHTIKYYKNELYKTLKYFEQNELTTNPSEMSSGFIQEQVILRMMDDNRKETTINATLRALRSFFNYLEKEAFILNNPMTNVKLVRQKRRVIQTFNREQIHAILRQPDRSTFTGLRDYTIMMFLLETGVRVKELCGIRLHDINWNDGVVVIRETKGVKERTVPVQKKMKYQLSQYLQIRGQVENDFLFINIEDEPLQIRAVQSAIAKYGRKAGINNVRCSPHTFRHTFAKLSVQNGADVFSLQSVLGHSSMEMVRNYVNLFTKDVAKSHKKFSPIEKLF